MHERIKEILEANNLQNEGWESPEGDDTSYEAEGADGTIYADYHSDSKEVIFSHHYGHQGAWDWESVVFREGDEFLCEEVQEWF